MANPNRLFIKYHPARRDISFNVMEDFNEVKTNYETLKKYSVGEKGKFILSLYGNDFFDDILKPFRGKDSVEIYIQTTRLEYEDFKQRVNEYNANKGKNDSEIKLLPLTEGDELVDMKTSFNEIKVQGEKIVKLLDSHWNDIQNIKCTSTNAKDYLMKVAEKIRIEKEGIEKNLKSLSEDNNVNLCLIGVHSSGKSTLINTLLGYKILPVDIRPETAKMLKIKGVSDQENSYIDFSMKENNVDKKCNIYWNKKEKRLIVKDSNISKGFMDSLNAELIKNKSCNLHEQLYFILDYLNKDEKINAKIDLGFPIPFNTNDLQFTIYDTPGADSNVGYHKKILSEALENQTNSILLFVLLPNSLSGSGNVELMNDLLEKSEKSSNVIDVEQSFFIFNYADAHATELDKIKNGKLKKSENDEDPVELSERKVFFVSAKCGFAAMATKNLVAGEEEKYTFEEDNPKTLNEKYGRYYKHNHFGKSEYTTKLMIENTGLALQKAEKTKDDCTKYLISSGIYTLQEEIKNYGERYASSVKTAAIIKSIESAAESVTRMVQETSLGTDEKVKDIQSRLDDEIGKVNEIINSTAKKYVGRLQTSIDEEISKVGISSTLFMNNVIEPVEDVLNKDLEKYLKLFNVHVDEQMQLAVQTDIEKIYKAYTDNYKEKRNKYLLDEQSAFIKDFMEQVEESEISEETKVRLRNFKLPEIPEFGLDKKIDELFDSAKLFEHENIKKVFRSIADGATFLSENLEASIDKDEAANKEKLSQNEENSVKESNSSMGGKIVDSAKKIGNKTGEFFTGVYNNSKKVVKQPMNILKGTLNDLSDTVGKWETKTVNKKEFITNVKDWFQKNQDNLTGKFKEDFRKAVNQMCNDLSDEFKGNIDTYSTKIRALKEDNKPLEMLSADIKVLQESICISKKELEEKI